MCSKLTSCQPASTSLLRRIRPAFLVGAVCAPLALSLAGCGLKGDPLPPLRSTPIRTSDLAVSQQGSWILLDMRYPQSTVGGQVLGGIDSVELLVLVKPLLAEGKLPTVEAREIEAAARTLVTLRGAELTAAVTGDRIAFRLPLTAELPETPSANFFAVRTHKGDEVSAISNLAPLVPVEPPPAPSDLELEPRPAGIALKWTLPEDVGNVQGFDIYRRQAQNRGYGEAIGRVPGDKREYVDRSASYGQRYIYTVRTVVSSEPLIQSTDAGETEVEYEDRFAPPLPKNFVALAERGSVRLRWDPSSVADVAGYVLYRREPGRDFHRITEEPITELEYLDTGLASGLSFSYRIQVVDRVGNESPLSAPVTTTTR